MNYTFMRGYNCRTITTFNGDLSGCNPLEMKSLVQQNDKARSIMGRIYNMGLSHTDEDIEYTLKTLHRGSSYFERKQWIKKKNVAGYLKGDPLNLCLGRQLTLTWNRKINERFIFFKNKTAIVTGALGLIGKIIASPTCRSRS